MVLIKYTSSGIQDWNATWGSSIHDRGHGVAVDLSDDVLITGECYGGGTPTWTDIGLIKFSNLGIEIWNKTWSDTGNEAGRDIVIDASNNIFVAGDQNAGATYQEILLFKYYKNGTLDWVNKKPGWILRGVAMDSSNNLYVTGNQLSGSPRHLFLAKYDNNGLQLWNRTWDSGADDYAYDIAVDSIDNVYVTGLSNYDLILVKFSPIGIELWNKTWDGGINDQGHGIAIDSYDNIYVTGYTYDQASSNFETLLIKYTDSGTQVWNLTWGGNQNDHGLGVVLDSNKNIYITGRTESYGSGNNDIFLLKYVQEKASTELRIGDVVETIVNLAVRNITDWDDPLNPNNLIFTMHPPDDRTNPPYDVGKIVDGPNNKSNYIWWKIEWDNGEIGWSAEKPLNPSDEIFIVKSSKEFVKIHDLEDPFDFQGQYELDIDKMSEEEKDALPYVMKYAKEYNISPALIMGFIRQESDFNPNAIGDGGQAIGYMQLWHIAVIDTYPPFDGDEYSGTEADWESDGLDPDLNIKYGARFIRIQYERVKDDNLNYKDIYNDILKSTISAYNAGHSTFDNRKDYVIEGVIEGRVVNSLHRGYKFFLSIMLEPQPPEDGETDTNPSIKGYQIFIFLVSLLGVGLIMTFLKKKIKVF